MPKKRRRKSGGGGGGGSKDGGSSRDSSSSGGGASSGGSASRDRSSSPPEEEENKMSGQDTPAQDPEKGESKTRKLRDDADSDPLNPQTEPVDVDPDDEPEQQSSSSTPDQQTSGGKKSGSTPFEGPDTTGGQPSSGTEIDEPANAPNPQVSEFSNEGTAKRVQEASEQAERRAAGQLNRQTGTDNFSEDDVDVRTERNEAGNLMLVTDLSSEGQQTVTETREKQGFQQAQQTTEADLDPEDVAVNTSGGTTTLELTDSGRRAEAAAQSDQFDESDLVVTSDGNVLVDRGDTGAAARALDGSRVGRDLDSGEAARTLDGSTEPLDTGRRARLLDGSTEPSGDIFTDGQQTVENTLNVDIPGDGRLVQRGREQENQSSGEQFGDINLTIPEGAGDAVRPALAVTGPVGQSLASVVEANEGRRSEDVGRELSGVFQENVVQPSASAVGDFAASESGDTFTEVAGSPGGQAALTPLGPVGTSIATALQSAPGENNAPPEARRAAAEGSVQAVGDVADVAGTAVLAKESGEFVIEGASETARGDGGEFAGDAAAAGALLGARTARYASENPVEFGGQLLGGVVIGSAAETAVRRGFRVGRRSSTPDVATDGGTADTSRTAQVRGAVQRSETAQRIQSEFGRFVDDERGQLGRSGSSKSGTGVDTDEITLTGEDLNVDREPARPPELRDDVDAGERARQQRRDRYEEGGMSDAERFDPDRGATMMERRAQRRRERAEEPQVTEPTPDIGRSDRAGLSPIGAVAGAGAGVLDRQAEAQTPTVIDTGASSVDVDLGSDIGLDLGPITSADLGLDTRRGIDTRGRTQGRSGVDTRARMNTGVDTRVRMDTAQSPISVGGMMQEQTERRAETESRGSRGRRRRFDLPDLRFGDGDTTDTDDSAEGFARIIERSLLNPFTGR